MTTSPETIQDNDNMSLATTRENATGAISLYNRMQDPMTAIDKMGEWLAKSGLFGCETVERGKVIALTCMADGITPIQFSRNYDVIGSRICMKAEAMLAELMRRKGSYKIEARTSDCASIYMKYGEVEYTSTVKWDQIKDEPYTKTRDPKVYKPVYASERGRMQMLWARAVSDGIHVTCPQINTGGLTPEEAMDFVEDATPATTVDIKMAKAKPVTATATTVTAPPKQTQPAPAAPPVQTTVVTAAPSKPAESAIDFAARVARTAPTQPVIVDVQAEAVVQPPEPEAPPFELDEPDKPLTGKALKLSKLTEEFATNEEQVALIGMCVKYKWLASADQPLFALDETVIDRLLKNPQGVRHTMAQIAKQ